MSKESPRLRVTKDYAIFEASPDNRVVNIEKRKSLAASMEKYGYLAAYPLHCRRIPNGKLQVLDGEHRLEIAGSQNLPVWYVVLDQDVNISEINCTQKTWSLRDFADCFAAQGNKHYVGLVEFVTAHRIGVGMAASLLAGTLTFHNISDDFMSGAFTIRQPERAAKIASLYTFLHNASRSLNGSRILAAIYACCFVPGFDSNHVRSGAARSPELLKAFATIDGYLTMLEDLHNFGRKDRLSLRIPAQDAMRARGATLQHKRVGEIKD